MSEALPVYEADSAIRELDVANALTLASGRVGGAVVKGYFSEKEIKETSNEAAKAAKYARNIGEWPRTRRATFFTERDDSTMKYAVVSKIFTASRFMPETTALVSELSRYVRSYGRRHSCPPLRDYDPNRIGVNVMRGTTAALAEIPEHTDPVEESGLVAVIELGDGKTRTHVTGDITFILGFDTCRHYGINQHAHSVQSDFRRYSVTAANLVRH